MNNSYTFSEISKTGSLTSSLIIRQYKLDLMAWFMEMKNKNPKLTQNEVAKELGYSSATVKLYRNDKNMPSPYGTQSNKNKRKQKIANYVSNKEPEPKVVPNEPKRVQKELPKPETNTKSNKKNKNSLKTGSIHENIEINDQYLDESLDNNDVQMDLAMQIISTDKTVRSETVQDLKDFILQNLTTQAKKGLSMMPAIKKVFNFLGDDIVGLHKEKESLKNEIGFYDGKWLEESKTKLLKLIDDEKRASIIMSGMKMQMNKEN